MNHDGIDPKLTDKLLPGDVQHYLNARGWLKVEGVPGEISVFRRPDDELVEIIVPLNPTYRDYASAMLEVVAIISHVEQRAVTAVVNDLLLPSSADILRFRLDDSNTRRGTVPFGDGLNLLMSAKKALLSSACSIAQPRRFHPRLSRAEVDEFYEKCQLGQTERGSYVASVICPIEFAPIPDVAHALFPEIVASDPEEPFSRKVTKGLIRSVDEITEAIRHDHMSQLLASLESEPRFSANFCEAFAEVEPLGDDAALEVSISWARTGQVPIDIPRTVTIHKGFFPAIRSLGRQLRPTQASQKPDRFIGLVDALEGSAGEDGCMQGEVVMSFVTDEGPVRARLNLPHEDYAHACDAHRDLLHVSVHGTLMRGARIGTITDFSNFSILSAD